MDSELTPEQALAGYAAELAEGVAAAMGPWVEQCVKRVADQWQPGLSVELAGQARAAGVVATDAVAPAVRDLLSHDVDQQRQNPLAIVRPAVRYPTEVLAAAGVPPVVRDGFAVEAFPDDIYDLTPASFKDLDPSLGDAGIAWGAAKAFVVRARHQPRA
ncbi:MAG: hypothetical protein ABI239_01995 [Aquihabitans sp.]